MLVMGNRRCIYRNQSIFGNWLGEPHCQSVVDLELLVSRREIGKWDLNKSYAFRCEICRFSGRILLLYVV